MPPFLVLIFFFFTVAAGPTPLKSEVFIFMRTGKTVAVIQAHMGSERLPGKVMLPLCGRPMIARLLYRASHPALLDEVWVAATSSPKDDELCKFLQKENFKVYRGSEADVLSS